MKFSPTLLPRFSSFALAIMLTCGLGVAWALCVTWIGILGISLISSKAVSETLVFTVDGSAFMQVYSYGSFPALTYRTLDGQPVDKAVIDLNTNSGYLSGPKGREWGLRDWQFRISAFGQLSFAPPSYWYLVHDGQLPGHAYLQGFDVRSKQQIGYLGLGGFRTDLPPVEEQFAINSRRQLTATSAGIDFGSEPRTVLKVPNIFVVSNDELYRVDLQKYTISRVDVPAKIVSIGTVKEPTSVKDENGVTFESRVAVRLPDRVLLMSEGGELLRTIVLPEEARDESVSIYATTVPDTTVIVRDDFHYPTTIYWLTDQGQVSRREQLKSPVAESNRRGIVWMIAGVASSPAVLSAITFLIYPQDVMRRDGLNYRAALAQAAAETWPPLLVLSVISAILAAICYFHYRRYHHSGGWAWVALVFLLGPMGLAGYWLQRRWPTRARCPNCGVLVPRDRQECLACDVEFPAPAMKGIEVFA